MGRHDAIITIRAFEPEDLPAYQRIHAHPAVVLQTMQPPHVALSELQGTIANMPNERNLVAEFERAIAGFGALMLFSGRRAHAATLGLAVDPDHYGKGVETALLGALLDLGERWYGVRRFETRVYTDDTPAIALYTSFGFEIEATHRQFAQRDGAFADAHTMARLVT